MYSIKGPWVQDLIYENSMIMISLSELHVAKCTGEAEFRDLFM